MAVNPNRHNLHSPDGLEGLERRFVEFGGGVSDAQLQWLEAQLAEARAAGQRVIVAGHIPFAPGTAPAPWCVVLLVLILFSAGRMAGSVAVHICCCAHSYQHNQPTSSTLKPAAQPPQRHSTKHSLLWNYDAVLRAIEASGVVAATLAGHAHM